MKKIILLCVFLPSILFSAMVENNRFDVLLDHQGHQTLFLCDCDDTLITSKQHLGSGRWRKHFRERAYEAGYSKETTETLLDKYWFLLQEIISVQPIENNTVDVVKELQKQHLVLVLTAREPCETLYTSRQLASVNMNFDTNQLEKEIAIPTKAPAIYKDGVILCGDNSKGDTLQAFLKHTKLNPKRIVFIDDKLEQVENVSKACETLGIPYTCIHYTGNESRMKSFNPHVADLQWEALPKILSDEEALKLLNP